MKLTVLAIVMAIGVVLADQHNGDREIRGHGIGHGHKGHNSGSFGGGHHQGGHVDDRQHGHDGLGGKLGDHFGQHGGSLGQHGGHAGQHGGHSGQYGGFSGHGGHH